ncbi:hypothetical protein MLD38_000173 [Melastoma candidum]|uniref:Uncharacterized protein n=1 Tax=Melastoma candidum TaxID=119954 RepID=A0ACB9SE52_9MYRT|nr:hypothetical protein MLD38_000173 [Melastoma candidum]
MLRVVETWTGISTALGGLVLAWTMLRQHIPPHLRSHVETYVHRLMGYFYPYIQITFPEFSGERLRRSEAYTAIQNYLMVSASARAKRLKADAVKDRKSLVLTIDENEEITDVFEGVKVWWSSTHVARNNFSFSFYPQLDEQKYFKLTVHRNHRGLITERYISHILDEGKVIAAQNRQRKLYANNPSSNWRDFWSKKWSHVTFEHPATFDTLAMDPTKKKEIVDDLEKFTKGKEYYAQIGKAWKRGYLLYGPPGTGKSTMIAAMANFLNYDVYDLELTTVKDNSELRKLLIETSGKSIIVIEDIDCSLDLTGQRKKQVKKDDENDDPAKKLANEEDKPSKVTLSGLLNFIDGIWSACGGERIIVFTTNHVEKLDPALIRRGRMDKHIEMSYCCFEAFKLPAKNYLNLNDVHELFPVVRDLLEVAEMTPADVAENLLPKSMDDDVDKRMKNLVAALERKVKEDEEARAKAEAEARAKVEAAVHPEGAGDESKEDDGNGKPGDGFANGALENGV